jgi:predicted esterase
MGKCFLLGLLSVWFCLEGCNNTSSNPPAFVLHVETSLVVNPTPGNHKATVVFLHGYRNNGQEMFNNFVNYGFHMGPNVRVVILQARTTDANPYPGWFPFTQFPWDEGVTGDLADQADLDRSAAVLLAHLRPEVVALGGDWSKIFLYGLSQGGMMSTWMGLMSNMKFGGVVNFVGCLPLMTVGTVSSAGMDMEVIHFHDPLDPTVPYRFAQGGYNAALAGGARHYEPIVQMTEPKEHHHGIERGAVETANEWILKRI